MSVRIHPTSTATSMLDIVTCKQMLQNELLKAAHKHSYLSVPDNFALPGVRYDVAQQPCPSIFLPDSEIMLCLVLSHLLGEQTTPTARCTALKRHLQMMQGDACIVDGKIVLTFSQKLHMARRQGFPIRYDQAWGTPRYLWFYLTEDMVCGRVLESSREELTGKDRRQQEALSLAVQNGGEKFSPALPSLDALSVHGPLLALIREGVQDRPVVTVKGLMTIFEQDEGECAGGTSLLKRIDQAIEDGLPIRRSYFSEEEVFVWFYLSEAMLGLLMSYVQRCAERDDMGGLVFQPISDHRLWIDRYVEVTGTVAKRRTERAERNNRFDHAPVPQPRSAPYATSYGGSEQVKLTLSHYDANVLQTADVLAYKWMGLNPGPYQRNESCVKLVIVLVRTVAVRQSWLVGQKRLYLNLVRRRVQMWAPELIQAGLADTFLIAMKLGTTVQWSPNAKRINVGRLLAPIIGELRVKGKHFNHRRRR